MIQTSKIKDQKRKVETRRALFIRLSTFGRSRDISVGRRGFTLVELLVVAAIIIVVSAVILANSGKLGGAFILDNFVYDMALSIRQAQSYGISVKNFGGNFDVAYGMHFDASTPTTYVLFADSNPKNGIYDPGATPTELVQSYTITRGFKINSLCTTLNSVSSEDCTRTHLDIVFKRPEPDALISANDISCTLIPAQCQLNARIILIAPRGDTKSVVVPNNGQISVQ